MRSNILPRERLSSSSAFRNSCPPINGEIAEYLFRGWDHGVWTMLMHLFPKADIPVLQMVLPTWPYKELVEFGRKLSPLRHEDVLIVGSGQVTHDMTGKLAADEAQAFDAYIGKAISDGRTQDIEAAETHPLFKEAHPTDEHIRPLLITLGAQENNTSRVSFPLTGFEFAVFSNRSVRWG